MGWIRIVLCLGGSLLEAILMIFVPLVLGFVSGITLFLALFFKRRRSVA
jgi:hypothetical protein